MWNSANFAAELLVKEFQDLFTFAKAMTKHQVSCF